MTKSTTSTPFVLSREAVSQEAAEAVMAGAAVAEADVATLDVSGPGVVPCLQGILTNDLVAAGDDGFLYGAVLTNKGTIISDMWIALGTGPTWLSVPAQGRDALR